MGGPMPLRKTESGTSETSEIGVAEAAGQAWIGGDAGLFRQGRGRSLVAEYRHQRSVSVTRKRTPLESEAGRK
jgi:hypothetical protein